MANINIINQQKELFRSKIQLNDYNKNIKINDDDNNQIKIENKYNSNIDISGLISCSKNYYEDLIKIFVDNEKIIKITNRENILNITGSGILYIVVENPNFFNKIFLNLNFLDKKKSFIFVKILVEKSINLNLIDYINSNNIFKYIQIIQKKETLVSHIQFTFKANQNLNISKLENNSKYYLNSTFYAKDSNLYIENKSFQTKENSISSLKVEGIIDKNSKIINDGKLKISNFAFNSKANQELKNLILEPNSKISSDPILEVENSQVECSHSTSISKLDKDIYFYMSSKGISEKEIKKLVINSFFIKNLDLIKSEKIRNIIRDKIKTNINLLFNQYK